MRAEVEHHLLLTASENHGVGESGASRNNLDGAATSVIKTSPLEEPSIYVPGPVCNRTVYDRGPEPDKDHHRDQATALSNTANNNGGGDTAELHLRELIRNGCNRNGLSNRTW